MTKSLENRAYVVFNPTIRSDPFYVIMKTLQDARAKFTAFGSRFHAEMAAIVEGTTPDLVSKLREYEGVSAVYTSGIPKKDIEHFSQIVAAGARVWNWEYGCQKESSLSDEEKRTLKEALRVGCDGE